MIMHKLNDINQLVGGFLDLQEQWESDPEAFNWEDLRALASTGAHCYNEGNGRSFQILCTDGMQHGEFHLRFLEYSIAAGFDPFKLVRTGSNETVAPVFSHESLELAAKDNPWSEQMRACLRNLSRSQFGYAADPDEKNLCDTESCRPDQCTTQL